MEREAGGLDGSLSKRESSTVSEISEWFVNGETGISSSAMAAVALGHKPKDKMAPLDPADLNRCMKLVNHCPQVKRAFPEIRNLSKRWATVIDHWDELSTMFVEEAGWDWDKGRSAPKTYARMKALGL